MSSLGAAPGGTATRQADLVESGDGTKPGGITEELLAGGNMNRVVRRGDHVHREAGPWTPTVHRLLDHLHGRGVTWLPRPVGRDELGREVLTHLPGTVPAYPLPGWVWTDATPLTAARWLAQVHDASLDFDRTDAVWQLPAHHPGEVVCLNDVAPHNMVFDADHRLSGWIDVDVASPGPRTWDLAHLAYRLVPLTGADDTGRGVPDVARSRRRLAELCRAYATASGTDAPPADVLETTVARLGELADLTAARAAAGAHQVAAHVAGYRSDIAWVRQHADRLR